MNNGQNPMNGQMNGSMNGQVNGGQNPGFIPQVGQAQQPAPNSFSSGQMQPTTPVFAAGNTVPQAGNSAVSNVDPAAGKAQRSMGMTVGLIIASVVAVTFVGLFVWMLVRYSEVSGDVNSQIQKATAVAVDENTKKLEAEFTEREKSPVKTFSGPADYGELSFKYPKTWSVYVAKDAANGGDFEAYLNPDMVYPVDKTTINALRVTIKDGSYDSVAKTFENAVKNKKATVTVRPVGGANANIYTGELPGFSKMNGICALLKVRDKAVMIQTDAQVFKGDFESVLDSVSYKS